MAYYIIKKSKELGLLKDKQAVVEATSGNMGIALAAMGAYYKHPVYIFMPKTASVERRKIMELYGAKVEIVDNFKEALEKCEVKARELNGFLPHQFENLLNIEAHYETTGKEILEQVREIEAFVSGVGTGGTLMGVAQFLKQNDENIQILAIEPENKPLLSGGVVKGAHKIAGIGDDFIPDLVDRNIIDKVILINDDDAINMSKKLAKELGLGVGISSGANFLGAVLSNYDNVATVFVDDSKKYLSTDLTKNIDNQEFISSKVKLLGFEVI